MPNSAYRLSGEGRSPDGVGELAVHHNVVSTERIRQGLDVRTTVHYFLSTLSNHES